MTQQIIDVGAAAEDHNGDELRIAFQKAVANFAELYAKADLLNFDANGNLIANVTMRTGTYASLITLAGSLGEIGICTDVQAFIVFNGVAGQAKAYFRNRMVSLCQFTLTTTSVANGSADIRLPFSNTGRLGDVFTVAGGYGSLPTLVYPDLRLHGNLRLAYNASITALTLSLYSEDAVGAGTYSHAGEYTIPVFMVSGVGAVVPFDMRIDPVVSIADASPGIRWYLAARHNGSSSVSVSVDWNRGIAYEVYSA
jgi:hypothetical protein